MKTLLSLALACAALAPIAAAAQTKRVYIAPDDHTDYLWSATDAQYADYFPRALDAYLDQIDATTTRPEDFQAHWNTDGSIWMWEYERQRTPAQFDRLMGRVRDGHVSMPLNTLVSVHGGSPLEAVLRDLYYAGRLERRFNLRFPLAIAMENQTASFGLGSVYAGAGAKYSWKGVCAGPAPGYCTNVPASGDRERDAYWWTGPDGSRLLTKWNSLHPALPSASDPNQGPGGYAEARYPREAVPFVTTNSGFQARWPYDVIGLIGAGWDDPEYIVPLTDTLRSFPRVAQDLSDSSRRVIVSDTVDFFRDFETAHGAALPEQGVSFGNEWEVNVAAFAEKSARVRRAVERLRAAEAMATLVALETPSFLAGREAARDAAFRSMGLFFEHNVGGGGPGVSNAQRVDFQERMADAIEAYVDDLHADAQAALGALLPAGPNPRFFVFNPLGFQRTDVADFAAPGTGAFHVVNLRTNTQIAAQAIGDGPDRRIRVLAPNIPSIGYTLFELRPGAGAKTFPNAGTFSGGTLSARFFSARMDERGALASLIERTRGNREWVRRSNGLAINDFGEGAGAVTLETNGPVSATLRADIPGPLPRTVRVTLYAGLGRVDFENVIGAGFDALKTYGFGFNVDAPLVRHEEVGAVVRARLAPDGAYSPRAQNSLYEWLTLNHFADMTSGDGAAGITLANADAYFMRLGNSTKASLDTATPRIDVLAGGRGNGDVISQIRDQGGDTRFTHRFSLRPHGTWNQTDAMRFALGATNPLVTGAVTGPASGAALPSLSFALATVPQRDMLLWAIKPAEEGIAAGVVTRLWNQSPGALSANVSINARYRSTQRRRTSHVETDLAAGDPLTLPTPTSARGNQIVTFKQVVTKR